MYRKRLITSALRKDLLQIDGLYARISKLRYELYDLKKEDCFELCGTCVACKDEGQRLELKEKEKWYVDEVKTVKVFRIGIKLPRALRGCLVEVSHD